MQVFRSGVFLGRAWPLQPHVVDAVVGDSAVTGCQAGHFIKDVTGGVILHRVAHGRRYIADDLPIRAGLAGRIEGFSHPLHAAFAVGEGAVLFGKAGGRQHHVRQLCGFRHEDLLHHHEVQPLQALDYQRLVRLTPNRVLAEGVKALQHTFVGLLDEVCDAPAPVCGNVHTPGLTELLPHGFIGDLLVAREHGVYSAHVAATLHVVLAAQGVHAGGDFADVAAQHGQVGQIHDVFGATRVLGDTQRVEDG